MALLFGFLFALILVAGLAASFTHTLGWTWNDGQNSLSGTSQQTSEQTHNTDVTVAANTTDFGVDIAFNYADLKSFFMLSSTDLTLETNSGSSPGNTLTLKAGVPYVWQYGGYGSNPFSVNVTRFFLTNGTAGAATVQIRMLLDV